MDTTTITVTVPAGYLFESTVNEITYQFDPAKMTNAALLYLIEYGAQRVVNDRCGGKDKTAEDKAKIALATIARLESPDFTERAPRGSSDPIIPYVRNILRESLRSSKTDTGKALWTEYKAAKDDAAKRNAILDDLFAKQEEPAQANLRKLATDAKAVADKARAEAKALADATEGLTI